MRTKLTSAFAAVVAALPAAAPLTAHAQVPATNCATFPGSVGVLVLCASLSSLGDDQQNAVCTATALPAATQTFVECQVENTAGGFFGQNEMNAPGFFAPTTLLTVVAPPNGLMACATGEASWLNDQATLAGVCSS